MSDIAIRVDGLGKAYQITRGSTRSRYRTLQEDLIGLVRRPFSRADAPRRETFWALKDISFEVKHGEVLGIIGRNGAGKSTLLKILSRITKPTVGRADLYGRVGSLLEVGTGFHPELTGRENVFLNGTILGMTRGDIQRRFDEIVAFAEVEQFLDTPVKRYSSGMYMRLAFAVAAHLEPEILVVDEVLAVGDAKFQEKCLGKMSEVAKQGRTVLFVSHNMDAVISLCQRVIWLSKGRIHLEGIASAVTATYLHGKTVDSNDAVFDPPIEIGNGMPVVVHKLEVKNDSDSYSGKFSVRDRLYIEIDWESLDSMYKPRIGVVIYANNSVPVLTTLDASSWSVGWLPPGRRVARCEIMSGLLNEGTYSIEVAGDSLENPNHTLHRRTGNLIRFDVYDDKSVSNRYYGQEGFYEDPWPGVILLDIPWHSKEIQ